ncbi:acyl-CoA desaturase [Rothia sp. ZJ932]|uniref:fatty acid desaturase family protein n=1 Tax=Rothia sp. ZJ932 TaxID=2810516 RepID=UPI0019688084|nr:acyl-CoA desaturase [Rothia sp. ZJ932]QRZ61441.1 acyl-CoA desaturase [Rothia sp. ZJ932]
MTQTLPASSPIQLTPQQLDALEEKFDAIHDEILAQRGEEDARYIRRVVKLQRSLEMLGRGSLLFAKHKPLWLLGVGSLSVSKILENMEIGHNVLHGQWDWMNDKEIHSTTWEWDFVTPSSGWQRTHNESHHVWTNVVGRDEDVGYNLLRMDDSQPWKPKHLLNPVMNAILAPGFEWGIAMYDIELNRFMTGQKSKKDTLRDVKRTLKKFGRQSAKDFVLSPALASLNGSGVAAIKGFVAANIIRNLWAHAVIFCGHFPDGVEVFSEEDIENETRGGWYVRQVLGSANIDGSKLMHFMTGNLSLQIEHHLFPDMPSNRLSEVAPRVRKICQEYGLPYNSGPLPVQILKTWRKVFRLALP